MAGVVNVLSSGLLHLGVATSVVIFSLFIFFKYLYKRGAPDSPLKSSQKKNTNKKGEGKSNHQAAKVPVTIEEDDWVKVKPTKLQSGQSPTKETAKAGAKNKKSDNQPKKSQKQQNKKAEKSPKTEHRDEEILLTPLLYAVFKAIVFAVYFLHPALLLSKPTVHSHLHSNFLDVYSVCVLRFGNISSLSIMYLCYPVRGISAVHNSGYFNVTLSFVRILSLFGYHIGYAHLHRLTGYTNSSRRLGKGKLGGKDSLLEHKCIIALMNWVDKCGLQNYTDVPFHSSLIWIPLVALQLSDFNVIESSSKTSFDVDDLLPVSDCS
ncbi:hypothetical protein EGR_02222 [Echinococcus granulosus]|uniref:Uncharacterized protein n=1 Tax=Echinococcus granulosus TaxID=6210 RepID=W6UPS1_ECHGR|nr:hypothetical protein EGR_02222 [Echinococcus granulosus]EUB62781.1 hypothetical protein EGR_02222 [Echinococcus granulosus]